MRKRFYLAFSILALCSLAYAQEPFRNPAMEPQDEFSKAFAEGRRLAREGRPDEAIGMFKKAARLRNDQCAECFQLIGNIYFYMSQYKDAAAAYKQLLALKPENEAAIYNSLGSSLYLQNDKKVLEEAVAAFERAISLSQGKIVKAHYNLGYALLKLGRTEEGVKALRTYLELDPTSNLAAGVRMVVENPALAKEKFAPGFSVKTITGEELSLEKYRGRIVLLDFWATWCVPCIVEMPHVKNIWKKYGGEQFVIIGVSLDEDSASLERYLKKEAIAWPQYLDEGAKVAMLYGVESIPHTVLIDQDGIVRAEGLRGGDLSSKIGELVKKLPKNGSSDGAKK